MQTVFSLQISHKKNHQTIDMKKNIPGEKQLNYLWASKMTNC